MRFTPVVSNLIFISSILYCHISGNDKAPTLVLFTLLLAFIFFVILAMKRSWGAALITGAPLFYFLIIIVLARLGWIDSELFIGFR